MGPVIFHSWECIRIPCVGLQRKEGFPASENWENLRLFPLHSHPKVWARHLINFCWWAIQICSEYSSEYQIFNFVVALEDIFRCLRLQSKLGICYLTVWMSYKTQTHLTSHRYPQKSERSTLVFTPYCMKYPIIPYSRDAFFIWRQQHSEQVCRKSVNIWTSCNITSNF